MRFVKSAMSTGKHKRSLHYIVLNQQVSFILEESGFS